MVWRRFAGVLTILGISTISCVLFLAQKNSRSTDVGAAGASQVPVDGGTPIQKGRVDVYLERVQGEDYDQLVNHLDQPEDFMSVGMTGDPQARMPQDCFEKCLACRRTGKLKTLLRELPPAAADEHCRQLFEKAFEHHRATREGALTAPVTTREVEIGGELVKTDEFKMQSVHSLHGVCAAIFLSAHFCPPDVVVAQMKRVETMCSDLRRSAGQRAASPSHAFAATFGCAPDLNYRATMLLFLLQNRLKPHKETQTAVQILIADHFQVTQIPVVAWDAETSYYDFTHRHRGVPIDRSKGVEEYAAYTWTTRDSDTEKHVVDELEKLVGNELASP